MFENVDGRTTDGRKTDAGVIGIVIAHLEAFGSDELKLPSEPYVLVTMTSFKGFGDEDV